MIKHCLIGLSALAFVACENNGSYSGSPSDRLNAMAEADFAPAPEAGAMRKAREMGVDVPRDISIVGFDNIEIGQAAYPPLTTLQVPHGQMGRHAAEYLIDLINGEGNLTSLELKTQLKIRASLGPAP